MAERKTSLLDDVEQGDAQKLQEKIRQVLSGETVLQRELGVSEEELEALYGVAYSTYQSGKYRDALKAFSMLASMNPYEFRFIFGTASCYQMLEEPMLGALLFQLAGSIEPRNPSPMLHTAECLAALKDKAGARVALEETVKRSDSNILYEPVRQRAEVMLANFTA